MLFTVLAFGAGVYASVRHPAPHSGQRRIEGGCLRPEGQFKRMKSHSGVLYGRKSFEGITKVMPQGDQAVYGYLSYSSRPGFLPGMYMLTDSGYELEWVDPFFTDYEVKIQSGYLLDDKVCGYAVDTFMGYLFASYYVEVDFTDGELLVYEEMPYEGGYFITLAYNHDDETIYGYGIDGNDDPCFMKVNPSEPTRIEPVKSLYSNDELCYSLTFNTVDGNLYGVNRIHEFVRIDASGEQVVIAKVPFAEYAEPFISGLVYVPSKDLFYWQATLLDGSTGLYTITPAGEVTSVVDCPYEEEFNFLVTRDQPVNLEVPLHPEIKSVDYARGAHTGSVSIVMPSECKNGEPILGKSEYAVAVDNVNMATGLASPGETVVVNLGEALADGYHMFTAWANYEGHRSPSVSKRAYIGNDVPLPPAGVKLTARGVEWQPVTSAEGMHGGYVELDKLVYVVSLNGEQIGETSGTSFAVELSEASMTAYTAAVYAKCNGFESAQAYSNKIVEGEPLSLPVSMAPTEEDFELMTVYDSNSDNEEDDRKWTHSNFYLDGNQVWIVPNSYADVSSVDYLFLPYFSIEDSEKYYTWSMEAKGDADDTSNEVFEVYLCNSLLPDGVIGMIMNVEDLTREFKTYEATFKVPEPGVYSVALFYGSRYVENDDYELGGVNARNFIIADNGLEAQSPGRVSELMAVPAGLGALKASVSFTFPTEDISGNPLSPDMVLTARVDCAGGVNVSGKPGQKIDGVDVETCQGDNTVSVSVSDTEGRNGLKVYVNVYTGVVKPGPVKSIRMEASSDMRTVHMSWDGPECGADGGYINPETVTYNIHALTSSPWGDMWEVIDEVGTATSYSYVPSEQNMQYLGISTANEAGTTEDLRYSSVLAGPPYTLPFTESFEGSEYSMTDTEPWMIYSVSDVDHEGEWVLRYLADQEPYLWQGSNEKALFAVTDVQDGQIRLGMPRFSTEGDGNVVMAMEMYVVGGAELVLKGEAFDMVAPVSIDLPHVQTAGGQWREVCVALPPALSNAPWVQLYLDAFMPDTKSYVGVRNVRVTVSAGVNSLLGLSEGCWATGGNGTITIHSDREATVVSPSGKIVKKVKGGTVMEVVPGVYVVDFGDKACKVAVK